MIEKLLKLGLVFVEYISCVGVKEGFLNCLANVLLFISGLCFGYCFAFVYLRRVINDDIDSFFSEPSAKKKKKTKKINKIFANTYVRTYQEDYNQLLWYERDMMNYIDHVKCKTIRYDPDQ